MSQEVIFGICTWVFGLIAAYFANRITFTERLTRIETKIDSFSDITDRLKKVEVDSTSSSVRIGFIESQMLNGGPYGK